MASGVARSSEAERLKLRQVFFGKIDAAQARVFFYVANDVGELEGEAAALGQGLGFRIAIAEDVDADQADHRCDAIAVEAEIFESLVLDGETGGAGGLRKDFGFFDVHGGAVGQFVEQSGGDMVAALGVGQGEQDGVVGGLALLGAVKGVKPGVEFLAALGQAQSGVVGDVVAAAHEGVDSAQGFALAAGQNEESVVEILGRGASDAATDRIGHDQLGRSGGPGNGDLLGAGAHIFLTPLGLCASWQALDAPPTAAPRAAPTGEKILLRAARATRASLRGFEMAGRFPRTA